MLRILVIGATGRFSGIVDQLLARGHTVEAEPQKFSARNSHTMSSSFPVLLFRDPGMRIFRWCDGYLDLFRSSTLTMSATPAPASATRRKTLPATCAEAWATVRMLMRSSSTRPMNSLMITTSRVATNALIPIPYLRRPLVD
jgi:hypothetical protein